MKSRLRRRLAQGAFGMTAAGVGLCLLTAQAAFALGTVGTATPTDPSTNATLSGTQASAQQFGLSLSPTSGQPVAFCSSSTSTNSTEEESYFVPASTSPASLTFSGSGINGTGNFQLFESSTSAPWGPVNTSTSGQVVAVPKDFVFGGIFPASVVMPTNAPTQWNAGIACAAPPTGGGNLQVTDYWNVVLTFSPSSDTNGYSWTIGTAAVTPESSLTAALPLGGAAVIGTGIFMNRRRRKQTEPAVSV